MTTHPSSRFGNPVYDETDLDIRQLLADDKLSEGFRDAILREQMAKLHVWKDALDKHWRTKQHPPVPVELSVVHVGSLDGMRRDEGRD